MSDRDILDDFASRARAGDGQFAIAFSIMRLAREHRTLQENLTFGEINNPNRVQGVFEKIAMVLEDISQALEAMREDEQ